MRKSIFTAVQMAPSDPILGVTEKFQADPNPKKVNLGVGHYYDENGKVPVLDCVRQAEQTISASHLPRSYLPIDGIQLYNRAVQDLLFGSGNAAVQARRIVTVQTPGGTGALNIGARFLHFLAPTAECWISDPTWENHRAIFECAGFKVNTYPYYNPNTRGIDFDGMLAAFKRLPTGTICVMHICCHNPTGVDLSTAQWKLILEEVNARGLIPFLDVAYQGFAESLEADVRVLRDFSNACPVMFVSSSFSKSLSLYGERVGALSIVTTDVSEKEKTLSQLKRIVRTNYSNPPTHGGHVAATVLTDSLLREMWESELSRMRDRINLIRSQLVNKVQEIRPEHDLKFLLTQRGLFSYCGLTRKQVDNLRSQYSIYAINSGRICIPALNPQNIDYVASAIADVVGPSAPWS